jgi:RNA polymerase sigma-70 factor (ECF subfamily)
MAEAAPTDPIGVGPADDLAASVAEQFSGRLRLFAARRLAGDLAAAEDVVQEALRTILEALRAGRVREPAAIAAFAFETARNLCMHRGRSRSREERALGRLAIVLPDPPPDALTAVISEERRSEVRAALQQLEDGDRRLLLMTYVDALSGEEIARELALSAGAVRVRRHRALTRLRALMGVTIAPDREQE